MKPKTEHSSEIEQPARDPIQYLWLGVMVLFVIAALGAIVHPVITGIFAIAGIGAALRGMDWYNSTRSQLQSLQVVSEQETQRAAAMEQRLQAIHELTVTMSATLDHDQILGTILQKGNIGLAKLDFKERLVAVAFLFRTADNQLHVAAAQRLTIIDLKKSTPGQNGILNKAIEKGRPVFGGAASKDVELSYYAGFQNALSTVAIPLQANFQNYGVIIYGSEHENAFAKEYAPLLATIGIQTTIALQNAVLYEDILAEKEKIVQAEENARKKLSRDLHDGPTQTVAGIAMRIDAIQGLIRANNPRKAYEELSKILDMANRTTKQIRYMLFAMRPLVLENQGFVAALEEMSKKFADTYQLRVVIQADPDAEVWLDDNAQGALFYVIEEAVNNARKHAKAEQVAVRVYRQQEFCFIEIEDNGEGFDVEAVNDGYHKRGSLGMVSMRERAELADGELRVQSRLGTGTRISIRIPLPPEVLTDTAKRKLINTERLTSHVQGNINLKETRFASQTAHTTLDE